MQEYDVNMKKSAASKEKSATKFLDVKLSGPREGGIRGSPTALDEAIGEGKQIKGGRDLQVTADVNVVNNCGFDAFIGIVYSTVASDRWYRWPLIADGATLVINDVDDPTIFIYGVTTGDYKTVWDSDFSPHCFATGDCLSARNVGSLKRGYSTYYICGAQRPDLSTSSTPPVLETDAPTSAPTRRAAVITSSIDNEWLQGHNTRRTQFYAQYGMGPKDLKWSPLLKRSARSYARKLLQIGGTSSCGIEHGYLGDSYGGENLSAVWSSGAFVSNPLTPESVLNGWFNEEINLPYGQKGHATQVVFRSTGYVGCAGSFKELDGGGQCYIAVCRYISPGNCNMDADNWLTRTLDDTSLCDPQCPPEGCF